MVFGLRKLELAPRTENDEVSDSVTNTILVDKRLDESNKISNMTKVVNIYQYML